MPTNLSLNGQQWLFKSYYGEDWRWRNAHMPGNRDFRHGWFPGQVPGSVLNDLLQSGQISTPYFEQNSLLSEWASQRTWLYRTSFVAGDELRNHQVSLVFEGVDYEAEFFLNGERLGDHCGMYTPVIFDVGSILKYGEENLLVVVIAAAPPEQPQVGRSSRVRTLKARMNYWWDFCPRLVHQGIWQDVYLRATGPARLETVFPRCELSEGFDRAAVSVECRVSSRINTKACLCIRLSLGNTIAAQMEANILLAEGDNLHTFQLELERPELWWPNGHGAQPLYSAETSLSLQGEPALADTATVEFGVRRIRFVPNQGAPADALPYTLEVNGKRMAIYGWNWVPMDALYGVDRPQKLERLLQLAARAGTNLLRVWGGGLIEKEAFYKGCDRLGLLIWQEFIQSSSGIDNQPATDPEFIAWVTAEARRIIPLRRHHPSLALWCGGNELMDLTSRPLDDSHPLLAALHAVVTELDPGRAWLPTSASGPVPGNSLAEIEKDPTQLHDVHGPWEYQGVDKQYTLYNRGSSLLHSEFGVEGITNLRALNAVMSPAHQFPVHRANPVWFHLAAWWVKEEMWQKTLGEFHSIDQAIRGTQFLQFEGLRYAVEADRRRWPQNSGTIPWQFNEPFPMAACTSAVDYFAEPKPVYEAVRAAYRPLHLTARYPTIAWGGREMFEAQLWVHHNGAGAAFSGELTWRLIGLQGQVFREGGSPVAVAGPQSLCLTEVRCPSAELVGELFFLDLVLQNATGEVAAQNRYLFSTAETLAPIFNQAPAEVQTTLVELQNHEWEVTIWNPGRSAALYLWFENEHDLADAAYVYFSENYFCLLPGETQRIRVSRLEEYGPKPVLRVSGWNIADQTIL